MGPTFFWIIPGDNPGIGNCRIALQFVPGHSKADTPHSTSTFPISSSGTSCRIAGIWIIRYWSLAHFVCVIKLALNLSLLYALSSMQTLSTFPPTGGFILLTLIRHSVTCGNSFFIRFRILRPRCSSNLDFTAISSFTKT